MGEEIDKTVAGLYGITDEELEEVRKTLMVLKGRDVLCENGRREDSKKEFL